MKTKEELSIEIAERLLKEWSIGKSSDLCECALTEMATVHEVASVIAEYLPPTEKEQG